MKINYLKLASAFDMLSYWAIILIPFSMAIAPAPMNVFMGMAVFGFLASSLLKKERLKLDAGVILPVLLFFIVGCLSVKNSIDLKDSLRGGVLRTAQYILILLVMLRQVRDRRHVRFICYSACAGLILASLDSIWQVVSGFSFIRHDYAPVVNIGLTRATASFKDSNTLGIYLSALAPIIIGMSLYYAKGKKKLILLALSIIAIAAIALTYSRPTLLALYVVLFFFGIVRRDRIMIGLLVILAVASPFIAPRSVRDWAKQVEYDPLRFMCNDDRIAVYLNSLNMIKAHPFIGVGNGAFMKSYKKYKDFPEYRNVVTLDEMKAHNNFLHMAGEVGLIGLGIFIWFLYAVFAASARIYRTQKDLFLKIFSLSLIASLIAFLVNGLTESSLYYSRVALIFWYIAGLSLALEKINGGKNPKKN